MERISENEAIEVLKRTQVIIGRASGKHVFFKAVEMGLELLEKKASGMIIELPVPEGKEVWTVDFDLPGTLMKRFEARKKCQEECQQEYIISKRHFELSMIKDWGITVFSSEAEAVEGIEKLKEAGVKNE